MLLIKLPTLKSIIFAISMAFLFAACGGASSDNSETSDSTNAAVEEDIKKIITEVPEPSKIPYLLEETGAEYDEKLPNNPESVENYKTTNNKAAINLGIYAADVGYVSIYEKAQDAIKYVNAARTLADHLSLTSAFEADVIKRFEENLDNRDTLVAIINESLAKTDTYLKENERNNVAVMIFAGTFIEGLYIGTELIANYPENDLPAEVKDQVLIPLVKVVLDQHKPLQDLIEVVNAYKEDDADFADLAKQLEELNKLYEELNIEEQIQNNEGDLILTDETIQSITDKTKEIRTSIVS